MAKISDEPCESRRVAVPNAFRASLKDDGRRLSRGVNPYQSVRSSAKTNKTEPRVPSPVFPTLQTFKVCRPPAETYALRTRREAPARRRHMHGSYTVRRGCSSAGRAPALQAGGRRFESAHLHQHIDNRIGLSRSSVMRVKQNWILFLKVEFDVTVKRASAIEEWL